MLTRRQARLRADAADAAEDKKTPGGEKEDRKQLRTEPIKVAEDAAAAATDCKRAEEEVQAVELPSATIDDISDLTLVSVFSLLQLEDLVRVSQVCSRWRALCESRRLWSGVELMAAVPVALALSSDSSESSDSFVWSDDGGEGGRGAFLAAVRSLRRAAGVARYSELEVTVAGYDSGPFRADFSDNANHLKLAMPCALLALRCLRDLCKPDVRLLQLNDPCGQITDFEAYVLWETIASKRNLATLRLCLSKTSRMLRSAFRWEERGALSSLTVTLAGGHAWDVLSLEPLEHCIRLHRGQLRSVHLPSEELEGLLALCPPSLRTLEAPLGEALLQLLRRGPPPSRLLVADDSRSGPASRGARLLADALGLPGLQAGLEALHVKLREDKGEDAGSLAGLERALACVSQCRGLVQVRLAGFGRLLADDRRGPAALAALAARLPCLRSLRLDAPFCRAPLLRALLPADGAGREPSGLPASFRLLALSGACVGGRAWPSLLRDLMQRRPAVHLAVDSGSHRCLRGSALASGRFIVLPHPTTAVHDEGCPAPAYIKKNYKAVFISDLS